MLVKDVEKKCHVSKQTLFYYEKEGLIKPARNENQYRDYSQKDIETIELILALRSMDISIATIKKIFNDELSVKEAILLQQKEIEHKQSDLKLADEKMKKYLKRKKVKIVLSFRENELFIDKDTLVFNDFIMTSKEIGTVHLSLCNELASFSGSLYTAIKFRYYVDLDFEIQHRIFQFQVYCDQNIYHLIDFLLAHHIKIDDPVGVISLCSQYRDCQALYQYLDRHYRELAKTYHLDNPRQPYSMKERYTSDIQKKVIAFIDKIIK